MKDQPPQKPVKKGEKNPNTSKNGQIVNDWENEFLSGTPKQKQNSKPTVNRKKGSSD